MGRTSSITMPSREDDVLVMSLKCKAEKAKVQGL